MIAPKKLESVSAALPAVSDSKGLQEALLFLKQNLQNCPLTLKEPPTKKFLHPLKAVFTPKAFKEKMDAKLGAIQRDNKSILDAHMKKHVDFGLSELKSSQLPQNIGVKFTVEELKLASQALLQSYLDSPGVGLVLTEEDKTEMFAGFTKLEATFNEVKPEIDFRRVKNSAHNMREGARFFSALDAFKETRYSPEKFSPQQVLSRKEALATGRENFKNTEVGKAYFEMIKSRSDSRLEKYETGDSHTQINVPNGPTVELLNSVNKEEFAEIPEHIKAAFDFKDTGSCYKLTLGQGGFGKVNLGRVLEKNGDVSYVAVKKVALDTPTFNQVVQIPAEGMRPTKNLTMTTGTPSIGFAAPFLVVSAPLVVTDK